MTVPLVPPLDRRRRRTHARVLDAANELFARQGFRGTGVDQLADGADVALSSIYANFPGGKADVYLALACRVAQQHTAEMTAVLDSATTATASRLPVELVVFDEYRRFHHDNPLAFRLLGLADVDSDDTALYASARAMIHGLLGDLVDRAVAASKLPPASARREILRLWATVNGLLGHGAGHFLDGDELADLLDTERADLAARTGRATR